MLNGPFPPWPNFTEEEISAAARVLASNKVNYWTGDEGRQFESEFADFAGTQHAIAVANGTVALDLALHGLGIGPGDEVIVTSRSFMASASCIINAGARPVFADVDPDSQNITAETIAPHLSARTRAIICVHLAGWPCDMDAIRDLVADRGIFLIEDCAQAHGAKYKGRPVGSLGDVAAWSFCQDKIMTTAGEGGMVTCDDSDLWKRMWAFKDHGKSWDAVYNRNHPPGFRWLHETVGTNWRLTEIQSAIGRIQLRRMPEWQRLRQQNAERTRAALAALAGPEGILRIPQLAEPDSVHAYYKFYAFVRPERLSQGVKRDTLVDWVNECGIPCFQGSCSEMYLEKAFDKYDCRPSAPLAVARELGETSMMFLVHPGVEAMEITLPPLPFGRA